MKVYILHSVLDMFLYIAKEKNTQKNRVRLSLRGGKVIVNQNPVIQTVVHTQICTIPKYS